MTPRATVLWVIVTAPVAVLRYARTVAARVLFGMGDAMMGAAWRVAPEDPPAARQGAWTPLILRCEVCGSERDADEWLIEWRRDDASE